VSPLADAVALTALAVLLATAYRHPSGRIEALVGLAAAAATLATGLLSVQDVEDVLRHLGPVIAFLVTILVVAEVCARAGVFTAAAHHVVTLSRDDPVRLLTGVFVLAAVVTVALSLDATVVLVAPVVVTAAVALGIPHRPGAQTCIRMANSASLLLPISNLTNLLAMHYLDLTFGGFALRMAPVLAVVLVVEYVVLRLLHRADLEVRPTRTLPDEPPGHARTPVVAVLVMLVGFAVLSPLGVEPFWVSGATAVVLVVWGLREGVLDVSRVVRAAHPGFAVFVLCLGVVVAALATGPLGEIVAEALPATTTYAALLGIALLATLLANLLTNLSATLLLVPLLEPLGTTAILAALIGLNVGSGLTYTGSLANLLWRRALVRHGVHPSFRDFHRVSLVATPLSLVAAITMLWLVS